LGHRSKVCSLVVDARLLTPVPYPMPPTRGVCAEVGLGWD